MNQHQATQINVEQIEAVLPQTQCGKCGYNGCKPYAEAIVAGESVNRCSPGGQAVVDTLTALLNQPSLPLDPGHYPDREPHTVFINEALCIGCTKCIQACPMDAIIGSTKQMHTIIVSDCTGCDLCLPPCPVDCIEIKPISDKAAQELLSSQRLNKNRGLFERKTKRLSNMKKSRGLTRQKAQKQNRHTMPVLEKKIIRGNAQLVKKAINAQREKLKALYKKTQNSDEKKRLMEQLNTLEKNPYETQSPAVNQKKTGNNPKHIQLAVLRSTLNRLLKQQRSFPEQSETLRQRINETTEKIDRLSIDD